MINLHLVLQGGGANVVTLMAVSQALEKLQKQGAINILSVTGVSAGSIAACMLASKVPTSQLRDRAIEHGEETVQKLIVTPPSSKPSLLVKLLTKLAAPKFEIESDIVSHVASLMNGQALLDESHIKKLFGEIFGTDNSEIYLSDLNLTTVVTATDLLDQRRIEYTSLTERSKTIVEALADSCALPFVFRGHKSENDIIDGGIAGNLPGASLTFNTGKDERVLGISFEDETASDQSNTSTPKYKKNILSYSWRLFTTALEGSVKENINLIEKAGGAIVYMPRHYDLIDFQSAFDDLKDDKKFGSRVDEAYSRISKVLREIEHSPLTYTSRTELEKKVILASEYLEGNSAVKQLEKITIVDLASSGNRDQVIQAARYYPDGGGVQVVSAKIASLEDGANSSDYDWEILDKEGHDITAERFILPLDENGWMKQSVYILNRNYTDKDEYFSVSQRSTGNLFGSFRSKNIDYIRHRSKQDTDTVIQIYMIPKSFGSRNDFAVTCLKSARLKMVERGVETKFLEDCLPSFKTGAIMKVSEIRKIVGRTSHTDKHLYGWKCEKVMKGNFCGSAIIDKR